ncbi:MAG: TIGR00730 family Rossman fold protein [Candidatus Gastranaerophilales bacterium]|nr:TIGR00730 family Rossman fold protein [Candidatus Gastranaerophilales bacterium]
MTNDTKIKNVCIFSSSSNNLAEVYYEAARQLGILLAQAGFNIVYGGGNLGTMLENAKAVKEFGGKVTGVMPEKLYEAGLGNINCDEFHVTKCMRTRKEKLDKISDAVIALAGGFGTLEELMEMIVQKQLGYNTKAIVILNTAGFYNNLVNFFNEMIEQKFAGPESKELCYVAQTPQDAVNYLINYQPKHFDIYEKLNLENKQKVQNI